MQAGAGVVMETMRRSAQRSSRGESFMSPLSISHVRALAGGAGALVMALFSSPALSQSPAPFAGMAGSWSGAGTITASSGVNERIRCRAKYAVLGGGRNLQQELRCASDSYKFEVSSNVVHDGVAISGVWSETTRNVSGNVSGQARAGQIQARVDGLGFSATLGVATSGNSQSVMIRPSNGEIIAVAITLHR